MKELFYQGEKGEENVYLITDKEFKDLISCWEEDRHYWCKRLEKGFSKSYVKHYGTPEEDVGKEVFVQKYYFGGKIQKRKIYKKDGEFYSLASLGWFLQPLSEKEIKELIPIDKFYEQGEKL